ncbi:CheR family methyltransferase [Pandoraea pnomenusa]|uniref:CheR family methyltransferase n=1 Tax=Pandoraea pnomenusa TaxID=93220 RepID=UPI00333F9974
MSHVAAIERLLYETMGLDAQTLGANAVERAVRARLAALSPEAQDAPSYSLYWQRLQQSPEELQALIEAVVVPETWFFRHRDAFKALAQMAQEARAERRGTAREAQPLRLLSLPCSTGEEPYSIAMTLFDAGFKANEFTIDAIDISERALAVAREGVYGRNSFRGPPGTLLFRDRYFTPVEAESFRVADAVRTQVRWQAGNLFDDTLIERIGTFDFVFFRNVLIYFDRDGQRRAIAALERLMRMGATLFAGPAEGGTLTTNGLTSTGHVQAFSFRVSGPVRDVVTPVATASRFTGTLDTFNVSPPANMVDAFAHRHTPLPHVTHTTHTTHTTHAALAAAPAPATASATPSAPRGTPDTVRNAPASHATVAAAATTGAPGSSPSSASSPSDDVRTQLEQAHLAADAGDFVRAVALCRSVLGTDRANAQAEYLLGLVEDARDNAQGALVHYRRALYLDPGHYEALVHCAAQLDARGDADGARRLLERAGRAEHTDPTAATDAPDRVRRHGARHR